jgi:uncharacterized protein YndB with AHSA1/START domain
MKKIFISIITALIVIVVALFIYAATLPNTFRVQRTATIKAQPEKIFALINDFHRWDSWSPWSKLDPNMKTIYEGPTNGNGAVYAWEGNDKIGKGRMEITETSPPSAIVIKLDFLKPFEAHNITEFTLITQGESTNITWVMYGPNSYMTKVMGIFFNMDKMIGSDFESGLANLKSIAEK